MGYQHVGAFGNFCVVARLAVENAVTHEHWYPIEVHAVNLDTRVAQIVYVGVEPIDRGSVKRFVVIAANENLVALGQVAKPVEEVDSFLLGAYHAEVAGMYHHIGFGQVVETAVAVVGVRQV